MSAHTPAIALSGQAPPAPPHESLRKWLLRRPGIVRLCLVLLLLLLWEIAARLFGDPLFVAAPSQIVLGLGALFNTPGIPYALVITGWELAVAFLLSAVFGIAIGLVLGINGFARRGFLPIVMMLYAMPQVTVIPIFMILFGIGPASKIAYGFSHGIFPIIVTVTAGVQNLKPILLVSSRSMGANRFQILRHVVLPHMVPSLFTGMRLGMTASLLGVVLAELYASETGVGYFSRKFAQAFNPTMLFGLIAVVAAIAILFNEAVRRAEVRLTAWRR